MKIPLILGFLLTLAACDSSKASNAPVPANNTGKNDRDRDASTVTPGDQGENETDLKITQKIRQDVMKIDGLSMSGKNVKIITKDAVVTLRGPVKSEKEKTDISTIATNTAGVKTVNNQIEIAPN